MKILTVDDSAIIRTIIRVAIVACRYEYLEAADGVEALEIIDKNYQDIALVLLDWNMPNMDGIELLTTVRNDSRYNEIPFMMVTAENNPSCIVNAIRHGVLNYVVKPFTSEELCIKIMQCLGIGASND